jgi:predicted N-acetyltransferase YhbS
MAALANRPLPSFAPADAPPFRLADETPADARPREALLDDAFGLQRFAKPSERLRAGRMPAAGLALVAKQEGAMVGTVRLWNVSAGGVPALLLGPLAVARSRRLHGVGGALMREAIARARELGHEAILLVGDEPYYRRFGFRADLTRNLALPGPVDRARFLALELREGALDDANGMVSATAPNRTRSAVRALARAA